MRIRHHLQQLQAVRGLNHTLLAASGSYAPSLVALYELRDIRTVDQGLMRWLSELFRNRSVAERPRPESQRGLSFNRAILYSALYI